MKKSDIKNKKYEAVIGLEIHAELKSKSKMFCGCKNDPFHSQPNENVCPVCLGMPGTLPVINRQAVEWTILTGLALNCKINKFTKWDRKNYFYPDLPKGYQISQYDLPICYGGHIEISNVKFPMSNQCQNPNDKCQKRRIGITRIHLEEDTGTSKHPEGQTEVDYSLLDFNRAGVPLMELVTEPDIRTAEEAKQFCQQYQQILRNLEIADADMEKGQMRCEANISIRKSRNNAKIKNNRGTTRKLGTKVEVKNLNSFKSVEKAIKYEIQRQTEALESGEKIIQETRGWDEKRRKTYTMRVKETSADYRYFPEPDLPPVTFSDKEINKLKKQLPELAQEKVKRYVDLAVSNYNASAIATSVKRSKYLDNFILIASPELVSEAADWIVNVISDLSIKEEKLLELLRLIKDGKISRGAAKDIIPEIKKGKSPIEIIKKRGLRQISDSSELEKIIDKVIKENSEAVAKIKSGGIGVMGFLVGQVMKETKGQANPQLVNKMLRKKIL